MARSMPSAPEDAVITSQPATISRLTLLGITNSFRDRQHTRDLLNVGLVIDDQHFVTGHCVFLVARRCADLSVRRYCGAVAPG